MAGNGKREGATIRWGRTPFGRENNNTRTAALDGCAKEPDRPHGAGCVNRGRGRRSHAAHATIPRSSGKPPCEPSIGLGRHHWAHVPSAERGGTHSRVS